MIKCKECKHWDVEYNVLWELNGKGWGRCAKHSHDRDESSIAGNQDMENVLADAVCFCEGVEGELVTKGEFACICGELKVNNFQ